MAITDLRFAASLLKEGFSADEVRQIIGLKENVSSPADEAEPDQGTEPEPEPEEQKPEEKPKDNPLTRNENQKKESLIDALAKAL